MSTSSNGNGGNSNDVAQLLNQLGMEALLHEAESKGLSPRGNRLRCPWEGCESKGAERDRDAVVFAGGHPRVHCYACGASGDLIDLLGRTRGLSRQEAIAHVRGVPVPDRAPLRIVGRTPESEVGKLTSGEAKRLWDSLAEDDELGQRYLASRHLNGAAEAGLVRFVREDCKDKTIALNAGRGHRVAMLLSDVNGQPRGMQFRLAREAKAKETKVLSAKGSAPSKAFFGAPGLIEAAPVVCVAEGMADTIAVDLWAEDRAVTVGAAGKGFLPRLAEELEAAGIDVAGKLFALFPQNDRPLNKSRAEFTRLAQLLKERKASVVYVRTPDEFKDVAEWRAARAEMEWPPEDLARAYTREPGDDSDTPLAMSTPSGFAVHVPTRVVVERYDQNFSTLCALLDDPVHREAAMGPGDLSWCEMSHEPQIGGRSIHEEDVSVVRLALERHCKATDGKPLRFASSDITEAIAMLARRRSVHPVREWLSGLKWDRASRMKGLGHALGHPSDSLQATMLRRWLVSAVARAMQPGCKVDTVLVLVGDQGSFKSSFADVMGGKWFTDSPVDTRDKDGKMIMRLNWIIEWAELDAMRRTKDQEQLKAFLSSRVDTFRPPFGKGVVSAPRHCVIVGTTNDRAFLHDSTGSRRFWPVEVQGSIDIAWVRENREQLWAEAVQLFTAGERWWLDSTEAAALEGVNEQHQAQDSWDDPIADWLAETKPAELTTGQVLKGALEKDRDTWGRADEMRVAAILRDLGWQGPHRVRRDGERRYIWSPPAKETVQ